MGRLILDGMAKGNSLFEKNRVFVCWVARKLDLRSKSSKDNLDPSSLRDLYTVPL